MSKYIKRDDCLKAIEVEIKIKGESNADTVKDALKKQIDNINALPTIEVSEDCISRTDAVKAIAKQLGRMHDTNPEAWEDVAKLWLEDCK